MVTERYRRPSIGATFDEMVSPREYNFGTDRVFAHIPVTAIRRMFRLSRAEKHATLAEIIARRFTSRDGFSSFYPSDLASWLSRPVTDWDHNELGTLLDAVLTIADFDPYSDEISDRLCEETLGDEGAYEAWSDAVDWPAYETARTEKRAVLLADWLADDRAACESWACAHETDLTALTAVDPSAFDPEWLASLKFRCTAKPDLFTAL